MKPKETVRKRDCPPAWAHKLLNRFCPPSMLEEVDGDLLEEYNYQLKTYGHREARWDYIINVIGYIQPFARRRKEANQRTSLLINIMWKNYLTTAIRNFARNRSYALLNLAGLTLGL